MNKYFFRGIVVSVSVVSIIYAVISTLELGFVAPVIAFTLCLVAVVVIAYDIGRSEKELKHELRRISDAD